MKIGSNAARRVWNRLLGRPPSETEEDRLREHLRHYAREVMDTQERLGRETRTAQHWKERHLADIAVIAQIRDAVGELFGPAASLESEEAVLLRGGTEIHHDGDAIVEALQRVAMRHDAVFANHLRWVGYLADNGETIPTSHMSQKEFVDFLIEKGQQSEEEEAERRAETIRQRMARDAELAAPVRGFVETMLKDYVGVQTGVGRRAMEDWLEQVILKYLRDHVT